MVCNLKHGMVTVKGLIPANVYANIKLGTWCRIDYITKMTKNIHKSPISLPLLPSLCFPSDCVSLL